MEAWVLAALAGICPVGWPRPSLDWDRLLWILKHFPPVPPPPRPDEGPRVPDPWKSGPGLPDPWKSSPFPLPWRLASGLLACGGGIAAWATIGPRFANDGLLAVIAIGFLGGCAALWVVDVAAGMAGRGNARG
jgi:hypothetical protein